MVMIVWEVREEVKEERGWPCAIRSVGTRRFVRLELAPVSKTQIGGETAGSGVSVGPS